MEKAGSYPGRREAGSGHAEEAKALFMEGYNCAQAVFCAFGDVTGLDRDRSARLASSFGGGLGRLREVCGAVSGAAMVLGAAKGYADPKDAKAKKEHYERVREFAGRFRDSEGSILCRELLAGAGPGGPGAAGRTGPGGAEIPSEAGPGGMSYSAKPGGPGIPEYARPGGDPEERTAEYYKKRPCPELVYRAARILEEMLAGMPDEMQSQG